eukprot:GSA25T00021902001.1
MKRAPPTGTSSEDGAKRYRTGNDVVDDGATPGFFNGTEDEVGGEFGATPVNYFNATSGLSRSNVDPSKPKNLEYDPDNEDSDDDEDEEALLDPFGGAGGEEGEGAGEDAAPLPRPAPGVVQPVPPPPLPDDNVLSPRATAAASSSRNNSRGDGAGEVPPQGIDGDEDGDMVPFHVLVMERDYDDDQLDACVPKDLKGDDKVEELINTLVHDPDIRPNAAFQAALVARRKREAKRRKEVVEAEKAGEDGAKKRSKYTKALAAKNGKKGAGKDQGQQFGGAPGKDNNMGNNESKGRKDGLGKVDHQGNKDGVLGKDPPPVGILMLQGKKGKDQQRMALKGKKGKGKDGKPDG